MKGEWLRNPSNKTSVIFVHGILSNGETCWRHKNGTYWPDLLKDEEEFQDMGIYVYTYQTSIGSSHYNLDDVVSDLKERLFRWDNGVNSRRLVFVCHSMGGIIVRKFIVVCAHELCKREIEIGLFLVASPSLGAGYANWLEPIAKLSGHAQAKALMFSQNNLWLNGLDREFLDLKESGRLKMYGKELIEDKFVIPKLWFFKQVVEPFTGAHYFGESYKVPLSDHFSIAKPESKEANQHRTLLSFLRHITSEDTRNIYPPDNMPDETFLEAYFNRIISHPLIRGWLFNGDYQIEPSDLLRIELREINFHFGDPIRAIRTGTSLKVQDLIEEIASTDTTASMDVIVLLGEAGVGKTITCKWLCRLLAQDKAKFSLAPLYVALGEWDANMDFLFMLDQQVRVGTFDDLVRAVQTAGYRLLLFLDGWNEQEPANLKQVRAFLRKREDLKNTIVVLTSRPVAEVHTMYEGNDVRFFEIRRWTEQQLETYFKINNQANLFTQIPKEALNCLRLPLLAFLLIRRLNQDEPLPSLHTVADVFAYVIGQFLGSNEKKSRAIPQSHVDLTKKPEVYLQKLAYQMTMDNVIQTSGVSLENVLSQSDKHHFKPFLASQINSGLLRSSNAIVALDPNANLDEVRRLKIGFLHQALQEYLTAQWLLSSDAHQLPPDVSHDAFWREVPIYVIQSRACSVEQQKEFAFRFLQGNAPDYLTSARLANEILDPGVRQNAQEQIIEKLRLNIKEPSTYPYAIEAIKALENKGQEALRVNLSNISLLQGIYARAEAHLVGGSIEGAEEEEWRTLGRSIYILGELGDFWLAEYLIKHIDSVRSLHLLYHMGEALLTLSRIPNLSDEYRKVIRNAGSELDKHSRSDSVVRSYAFAIGRTCGCDADHQKERATELKDFLNMQSSDITRQYFREEFWRRAHGAEAFVEVAGPSTSVDILVRLFETEDIANYGEYMDGNYHQVQSSILKAVLRSCDLYHGTTKYWLPLLEKIFQSERVSDNGWACRHLELLLLKWFSGQNDMCWVNNWKGSEKLGGSGIAKVLSNVIWLSS